MTFDNRHWTAGMDQRDDWLGLVREEIIDPLRPIIDPHHHLWNRPHSVYEMEQLHRDTGDGHNVIATVYIECRSYYDTDAEPRLCSLGETRTITAMAKQAKGGAKLAGIVANVDLRDDDLDTLLDMHIEVSEGLVKGIRHSGSRDSEPDELSIPGRGDEGLYRDPDFRRGVARLGERGLTYDTWHYHHQADDYLSLAQAVPGTKMVLNHFGVPLGVGRFRGKRDEIISIWKRNMAELAKCPNVHVKLGGHAMPDCGWEWHKRDTPVTSDEFVAAQGEMYHHMIECFGPGRCMFESNFPVDRVSLSYHVLWNAFKKIASDYDNASRDAMLSETARGFYGL